MMCHKGGSHPLIQEHNALVDRCREISAQLDREAREAWKGWKPVYKLTSAYSEIHFGRQGVIFTLTLVNKEKYDHLMSLYGHGPGCNETIHTINYSLVNGVLCRRGGGNLVFGGHDEIVTLTEEEWMSLCALKVPDKLKSASKFYIFAD